MNSQVTAALIAAVVSLISLIGTVVVATVGFRTTRRVAERTIEAGHEDNSHALAEQRQQLERTLAEQHARTLNERFASAADQLGTDKPPAVRLAGAYAMAKLADDWVENRQICVDVLCAYLRLPYEPDPGDQAPAAKRLEFRASQEVRYTVIRIITGHLRKGAAVSWQGLNFDFTGVVFDGGDFTFAEFSGGTVSFGDAEFSGGTVSFGTPSSPAARSASVTPSSPAARSASTGPNSPAVRSASSVPGSPTGRSASVTPSSPAVR